MTGVIIRNLDMDGYRGRLCEDTGEKWLIYKPRREVLEETNLTSTLTLHLQPPEL
jgi:hypothetical protein